MCYAITDSESELAFLQRTEEMKHICIIGSNSIVLYTYIRNMYDTTIIKEN